MCYDDDDCSRADYMEFAHNFKLFLEKIERRKAMPKSEKRKFTQVWTENFPIDTKLKDFYSKIVLYINNKGSEVAIIWLKDGTRHFGYVDAYGRIESDTVDDLWWTGDHRLECLRNEKARAFAKMVQTENKKQSSWTFSEWLNILK